MNHPKTLDQLRKDPRIEEVWKEDDGSAFGTAYAYWATLTDGWINSLDECHSLHEPTVKQLISELRFVKRERQTAHQERRPSPGPMGGPMAGPARDSR